MAAGTVSSLVEQYPLLVTKLSIPNLELELVARPHLLARLHQAVARPLVVVAAPAGWGKTTLLAAWVRQAGQPVAWLSLDEGDNELARFWLHLIAALQQIRPGVGEAALVWFYAREAPPVEARLALLINDLALADETFVLVLDDYHYVHSPAIHASLVFFVEHPPPNVHLILTSRSELPLPIARWRARRRLVEFDSHDLRFSVEECAEFLHVMGLPLTPEQRDAFLARTEGWVTGLQLIALALQDRSNPDGFIAGLGARSRYIADYLSQEVLARQPPTIQEFLIRTSVLERLSAELCEAVTGRGDSQHMLELLERLKLFIIALDEERRWFRYHSLFRDFLRSQLGRSRPEITGELHRRAAQWYAANGLPHDAVSHALAAQDYELAGRITLENANELWRRQEQLSLRVWLEALPLALRERHPDVCLFHAWSLFSTLRIDEILSLLARAEALLTDGALPLANFSTDELRGILATIQAAVTVVQQDLGATAEFAQAALTQLPPEQKDWRYAALVGAGLAHHYHNDTDAAVLAFTEAFAEAVAFKRGTGDFYGRAFAASWLARLYVVQGRLYQAKEVYEEALALVTGQTGKLLPTAAWTLSGLGELYFQWNDLALAEEYFHKSLALSARPTPATAPPYLALARLAQARGDPRSAKAFLTEAVRLAERANLPSYRREVTLCRMWLALRQGEHKATLAKWIHEQGLELAQPSPSREAEYVMAARILITLQEYRGALELIEKLLVLAEAGGRGGVVIELLILQALALQRQAESEPAMATLQQALARAEPERYVRLFVDEGDAMLRLLRLLVARAGATDYTARLLSAFTRQEDSPDALNDRESEILRLLATGMSNREIAESLVITVGTVKWHTNHIYSKLGVKNRSQAVAKAREFRLLD
ncbi:MAG: hypothetical protein DCC55_16700 [Chloroflexi bacterium]|nr:MAG: hypothetical protein DCC55_16700 [Chloroflexota bacterium]